MHRRHFRGVSKMKPRQPPKIWLERLHSGEPAIVPAHWPTEVMNGLMMAVRRRRIDLETVIRFKYALESLPIFIQPPHGLRHGMPRSDWPLNMN